MSPLRILRADPLEPTADQFPALFDTAAESTGQGDVIRMGPERFEGFWLPVLKIERVAYALNNQPVEWRVSAYITAEVSCAASI